MKDLAKKNLMVAAIANAFVSNPTADVLFYTEDGNCFTEGNKGYAEWHAKSTKQSVQKAKREDWEAEIENIKLSNEEVKNTEVAGEKIENTDVEKLEITEVPEAKTTKRSNKK